jgi:hypothetical protein
MNQKRRRPFRNRLTWLNPLPSYQNDEVRILFKISTAIKNLISNLLQQYREKQKQKKLKERIDMLFKILMQKKKC